MSTVSRQIKIVDTLPKPQELPDGTIYGYYSVSIPKGDKLIPYHFVKQVDERLDTETAFTRDFLKSLGRRKARQEEYYNYRLARPPLFVRPCIIKDAAYIDIKAAYPSIYKFLGWNTDYIRGKYWGVSDQLVYPYPMEWKAGRSYVITGARHLQYGRYIDHGAVKVKPYMSQFSNPSLVAGVYDVLACAARFAAYALQAGYWNVDGGIMSMDAARVMVEFLATFGLTAKIKYEGRAVVLASGYWKVGNHETVLYKQDKASNIRQGDYIGISKDEAEWIYKNFRSISERNI